MQHTTYHLAACLQPAPAPPSPPSSSPTYELQHEGLKHHTNRGSSTLGARGPTASPPSYKHLDYEHFSRSSHESMPTAEFEGGGGYAGLQEREPTVTAAPAHAPTADQGYSYSEFGRSSRGSSSHTSPPHRRHLPPQSSHAELRESGGSDSDHMHSHHVASTRAQQQQQPAEQSGGGGGGGGGGKGVTGMFRNFGKRAIKTAQAGLHQLEAALEERREQHHQHQLQQQQHHHHQSADPSHTHHPSHSKDNPHQQHSRSHRPAPPPPLANPLSTHRPIPAPGVMPIPDRDLPQGAYGSLHPSAHHHDSQRPSNRTSNVGHSSSLEEQQAWRARQSLGNAPGYVAGSGGPGGGARVVTLCVGIHRYIYMHRFALR